MTLYAGRNAHCLPGIRGIECLLESPRNIDGSLREESPEERMQRLMVYQHAAMICLVTPHDAAIAAIANKAVSYRFRTLVHSQSR